jgi:hypothetical protein
LSFSTQNQFKYDIGGFLYHFSIDILNWEAYAMLQGKVIIKFEYDAEKEKCHWDLKQDGKDRLSKDDLIQLLQHCIGELMSE